jgi:hypothetical protein
MNKFDFDYLLKRSVLINEMARPNYWAVAVPMFNSEVYSPVLKAMQIEGQLGTAHAREKTIEYLGYSILDKYGKSKNFKEYTNSTTKTGPGKNYTPEFANWLESNGWTWSTQKEKEFALYTLVKKYEKKLISPEVKEYLLNPENIIEYLDAPSFIKKKPDEEINSYEDIEYLVNKARESGDSGGDLNRRRLKLFLQGRKELSPEDIKYIKSHRFMDDKGMTMDENDIRDLLPRKQHSKDKMETHGRRIPNSGVAQFYNRKMKEMLGLTRQEKDAIYTQIRPIIKKIRELNKLDKKGQLTPKASQSPEMEFSENLIDELTHIMSVKTNTNLARNKLELKLASHPQLSDELIGNLIDQISSEEEGMTKEKFMDIVSQYNSNDIKAFGNYLVKQAKQQVSDNMDDESKNYEGYSEEVLSQVLDTPEKEELFDRWYYLTRKDQENKINDAGKADAAAVRKHSDVFMSDVDIKTIKQEISKLESRLDKLNDCNLPKTAASLRLPDIM